MNRFFLLDKKSKFVFLTAGGFSLILYGFISQLPEMNNDTIPYFVSLLMVLGGIYLGLIAFINRKNIPLNWIWLGAILFRLMILFSGYLSSDDVFRYIWDGHLINAGVNPYQYVVNAAELDRFEIPERQLINHDWMASPYLLTAQGYFGLITRLFPQSVFAFQLVNGILDLLIGVFLNQMLGLLHRNRSLILIYLWHPLVIIESILGIHIDFLMVLLIMMSLYWIVRSLVDKEKNSRFLNFSSFWFIAAVLVKGWPLLFIPVLGWLWGWRRCLFIGLSVVMGILLFVPSVGLGLFGELEGTGVFGAIRIYFQYWEFNGSLVPLLKGFVYRLLNRPADGFTAERVNQIVRLVMLGVFGVGIGWITLFFKKNVGRWKKSDQVLDAAIQSMLLIYGLFLLISATVHPWYLVLLIPLLVLSSEKILQSPWLYFSILVMLSYLVYLEPKIIWIPWMVYVPVYALFFWGMIRRRLFFEILN